MTRCTIIPIRTITFVTHITVTIITSDRLCNGTRHITRIYFAKFTKTRILHYPIYKLRIIRSPLERITYNIRYMLGIGVIKLRNLFFTPARQCPTYIFTPIIKQAYKLITRKYSKRPFQQLQAITEKVFGYSITPIPSTIFKNLFLDIQW